MRKVVNGTSAPRHEISSGMHARSESAACSASAELSALGGFREMSRSQQSRSSSARVETKVEKCDVSCDTWRASDL